MGYLFPYAGCERRPDPPKIIKKKPRVQVALPPIPPRAASAAPAEKPDRPLKIPPIRDSMRKVLVEVCERHAIHPNDMVGEHRAMKYVHARREYVWRCKTELHSAFAAIGRSINKDHTTIIHAYNLVLAGESYEPITCAREDRKYCAKMSEQDEAMWEMFQTMKYPEIVEKTGIPVEKLRRTKSYLKGKVAARAKRALESK